jgi:uncharacterized membrane protein YedE/YeeE
MTEFTPIASFLGGAMIGLSALMLLVLSGRIAGISGIVGQLISNPGSDAGWRIAFILGLILAGPVLLLITGSVPQAQVTNSWWLLIPAGLLVGFGTRMGSGCTSGHGICGLARLSPRSIAATGVFMATAFVTVFIARHVVGG